MLAMLRNFERTSLAPPSIILSPLHPSNVEILKPFLTSQSCEMTMVNFFSFSAYTTLPYAFVYAVLLSWKGFSQLRYYIF